MATCLVLGSTETTIIVSVLNVPLPPRWSVPTRSTLSRSVPFHGGSVAAGTAPVLVPIGDGMSEDGLAVSLGRLLESPESDGSSAASDGPGVASGWLHDGSVLSGLRQFTTSSASVL